MSKWLRTIVLLALLWSVIWLFISYLHRDIAGEIFYGFAVISNLLILLLDKDT